MFYRYSKLLQNQILIIHLFVVWMSAIPSPGGGEGMTDIQANHLVLKLSNFNFENTRDWLRKPFVLIIGFI